jgi:nucleoside-diphosphate-sugar epimerase
MIKTLKGKKILVTGADGFIGRALMKRLRESGALVTGLDLKDADICDLNSLLKFKSGRKFDLVYHLASVSYVPRAWKDPQGMYNTNLLGTLNVLEFCRVRKVPKLVFMSSYVYGRPQYLPIDEAHPVAPSNPYAWSKYLGELLCQAYANDFGLNCVVLRPFNVYGPGQKADFLIPTIMSQVAKSGKVVVKDLKPKRDFLYLDDMVEALLAAGRSRTKRLGVVNIGYGQSFSIRQIIDLAGKNSGRKIAVGSLGEKRRGEINDVVAAIGTAKRKLHWRPSVGLREGLGRMAADG